MYSSESRDLYLRCLHAELQTHHWTFLPDTLYFGGGTPSLMTTEEMSVLFDAIPREQLSEITLECAPGTITKDRIALWRQFGINRVSLGVQSFVPDELRAVGRRHTTSIVESEVELLRASGLSDISIDLIAGLPHQTRASWRHSLQLAIDLGVPHVSIYMFEVDEDSRLGQEALLGGVRYGAGVLPNDETVAELYGTAVDALKTVNLERYEISNFARTGWESRHNLKYWNRQPYVGFGLDAHSFDGEKRWRNTDSLSDYLAGESPQAEPVNAIEERFLVGLRLASGFQPSQEERRVFAEPIKKWKEVGLLQEHSSNLRLSDAGVLLCNEVLQDFLLPSA